MDKTKHDLSTVSGRITAACEWFDIAPPDFEYDSTEAEGLLLTDRLIDWVHDAGCSHDWIFVGDPKGMAIAFKSSEEQRVELKDVIKDLDPGEVSMMATALRATVDGKLDVRVAMAAWKAAVETYQKDQAA